MEYIKSHELRKIIFNEINRTIETHRDSKNSYFLFEYYPYAAEQEINDFIKSIPYFKDELKSFLSNSFIGDKGTLITSAWKQEFRKKVYMWAESFEWLYGDVKFICDPSLNLDHIKNEKDQLGLLETINKIKSTEFFNALQIQNAKHKTMKEVMISIKK